MAQLDKVFAAVAALNVKLDTHLAADAANVAALAEKDAKIAALQTEVDSFVELTDAEIDALIGAVDATGAKL